LQTVIFGIKQKSLSHFLRLDLISKYRVNHSNFIERHSFSTHSKFVINWQVFTFKRFCTDDRQYFFELCLCTAVVQLSTICESTTEEKQEYDAIIELMSCIIYIFDACFSHKPSALLLNAFLVRTFVNEQKTFFHTVRHP
jgi:hypothetical protein